MEKTVLSTTHPMGFCDEERPCGRCEEYAALIDKIALGGLLYDTPTLAAHPGAR